MIPGCDFFKSDFLFYCLLVEKFSTGRRATDDEVRENLAKVAVADWTFE